MNRVLKIAGITAVAGLLGMAGPAFATCVLEGPYSIVSCAGIGPGSPQYFAPEPGGALPPVPVNQGGPGPNPVIPTWWQLGFGNENVNDPIGGEGDTTGGAYFVAATIPADVFFGNDKGTGNNSIGGGLDLREASQFDTGGAGVPTNALCFGAASNWGAAGIDGCCDNNRNYYIPGGTGDVSDSQLNPYYSTPPAAYAYSKMKDSPIGILMREPTNTRFAAAFVRNRPRPGKDPGDVTAGAWDLSRIINGEPNPAQGGAPNVVPWQNIPVGNVSATFQNPGDPANSPRILDVSWTSIRLVHDGSVLPSEDYMAGYANGYDSDLNPITGMGVLDQPELATYFVQEKPALLGGTCDPLAPWVNLAGPIAHSGDLTPHNASGLIVDPDTCVRVCTHLGRIPAKAFVAPATKTDRPIRQKESQRGLYGDIGYDLCGAPKIVGGPLVSQRANLTAIERSQSVITIRFETTVELDITGIDVVGLDQKGGRRVLTTVEPQQGSTGVGATYAIEVPRNIFRDTKQVQIVLQPSGEGSNLLEVR